MVKQRKGQNIKSTKNIGQSESTTSNDSLNNGSIQKSSNPYSVPGWSNLLDLFVYVFFMRLVPLKMENFGNLVNWVSSRNCIKLTLVTFIIIFRYCLAFFIPLITQKLSLQLLYLFLSHLIISYCIFTKIDPFLICLALYSIAFFSELKMFSLFVETLETRPFVEYFKFLLSPVLVFKEFGCLQRRRNKKKMILFALNTIMGSYVLCFLSNSVILPLLDKIVTDASILNKANDFIFCTLPTVTTFLIFFRTVFIYFFGLLKEVTLFSGDSYEDWWNSSSSAEFWKKWNLYTHMFIKRYIYKPLRIRNYSFFVSSSCSFIFSGIFHEYVLSMALKKFNGVFFIAMLFQVPLHYLTDYVQKKLPTYSNSLFWTIFSIFGQTAGLLLIYLRYIR